LARTWSNRVFLFLLSFLILLFFVTFDRLWLIWQRSECGLCRVFVVGEFL